MKIVFVQFGDYAAAFQRMTRGEPETYRDQNRSVDFVKALSAEHDVTVLSFEKNADTVELTPTLRGRHVPISKRGRTSMAMILGDMQIDRLICRTPHAPTLQYARAQAIPTLPVFADIFEPARLPRLRRLWTHHQLKRSLQGTHVHAAANHSLNASEALHTVLGVPETRIVPWDWSRLTAHAEPKAAVATEYAPRIFYAGTISEAKGVRECIKAVALLRREGFEPTLTLAGGGNLTIWRKLVVEQGVEDRVHFPGMISQTEVKAEMRAHDIIVVPSRHSYAEGLPNTIYEGLASRSALIVSNHPAFKGRLAPEQNCLEFRAGLAEDLARQIRRLATEADLYKRVSVQAAEALNGLYVGIDWCDLVTLFIEDPQNNTGWVQKNSLETWRHQQNAS